MHTEVEMRSRRYEEYISSGRWSRRRRRLLKNHTLCLGCLRTFDIEQLQLHHVNYESLEKETRKDVLPLCSICHEAMHEYLVTWNLSVTKTRYVWKDVFRVELDERRDWPSWGNEPSKKNKPRWLKKKLRRKRSVAG